MKFKNILSLSMALTMAFTATLSSSASIFADDVEISQADESLSFTSSFFDEILEQSEQSNIENSDEYGISPMWLKDDHQNMLDSIINNYGTQEFKNNKETIKLGAFEADDKLKNSCKNLHGKDNYVASLKFLWKFAKCLGKKDSLDTAKNTALSSLPAGLRGGDMKIMANNIVKYIKNNHSSYSLVNKKCYVIGLTCHLISDVFAHRMIVPNYTSFAKSDFDSNPNIKTFDIPTLKKIAKNPGDNMESKYKKCEYFVEIVKLGVMEFRDIKHFVKSTVQNSKYEDNISFYNNRYKNSVDALECFIQNFKDGFDESIFVPYYGLKLNNYYGYVKDMGINTSYFTQSEWNRYSTMALV